MKDWSNGYQAAPPAYALIRLSPTSQLRFVVDTMGIESVRAAVVFVLENFFGLPNFLDHDHLDTYRGCLMAFLAADGLGEIDILANIGIFSW